MAVLLCSLLPVVTAADTSCVDVLGELQQGGVIHGTVLPGSSLAVNGETIDVLPDGTFFAGFGRDAPARATLTLVSPEGNCTQTLSIAARQYNIQRVEGVPQKTVTPSREHQARIAREQALVRAAKGQRLQRPDLLQEALDGFSWPAVGPISGVYGSQRIYNGKPGSPHYGVDVALPTGSPVLAPSSGVVTLAERDLFFSGGTVILDHGYGLSSSFLHMSKVSVAVGQELQRGDLIGEIGSTGRATGPHLDWRMSWRDERIDPQLLVPPMPQAASASAAASP
ncbi:MAG: M23 family metallopeptidase [Halioglobus sp.]